MAVPFITVNQGRKPLACKPGSTLLDALVENGVVVDNPCNGKGTCGKCRVRVRSDTLTPATETEKRLVPRKELDSGVRLACQLVPTEDMSVELMQGERGHTVLTEGILPDFTHKVDIEKKTVTIEKPTLENQEPLADQIARQLGLDALSVVAVAHVLLQPGRYTAVMHEGQLIAVEPGDTTEALYGVAIDIGTTTVVWNGRHALGDIWTCIADHARSIRLDVLTRITYELEHPENGRENLQKAIVDSLNEMIGSACAEAGVARSSVYEVTVGANCTMMHMLLGVDATPIGKAPFAPVFARAQDIPADAIGLDVAAGARLYCLPHVSAYIGADIVAGAYVCQLQHETGNVLFIDIGTNGEIVLANDGRLICCSCAAGPALEGMNISAGMRASEGAIEEIRVSEDGISCTVIGDGEPAGLCGSGILAVMRELLSTGIVRKNGAFAKIVLPRR